MVRVAAERDLSALEPARPATCRRRSATRPSFAPRQRNATYVSRTIRDETCDNRRDVVSRTRLATTRRDVRATDDPYGVSASPRTATRSVPLFKGRPVAGRFLTFSPKSSPRVPRTARGRGGRPERARARWTAAVACTSAEMVGRYVGSRIPRSSARAASMHLACSQLYRPSARFAVARIASTTRRTQSNLSLAMILSLVTPRRRRRSDVHHTRLAPTGLTGTLNLPNRASHFASSSWRQSDFVLR